MKCGRSASGGRRLHLSTLSLGDQTQTTYRTTHSESFSGWNREGQPLKYQWNNPCYPAQHYSSTDLHDVPARPSYTSTHSRDVHSPKDVIPPSVLHSLRSRNRTRNREGLTMKEITNPPEFTAYISSSHTQHCISTNSPQTRASGQPSTWHQHNILTGEDKGPAEPET